MKIRNWQMLLFGKALKPYLVKDYNFPITLDWWLYQYAQAFELAEQRFFTEKEMLLHRYAKKDDHKHVVYDNTGNPVMIDGKQSVFLKNFRDLLEITIEFPIYKLEETVLCYENEDLDYHVLTFEEYTTLKSILCEPEKFLMELK